MDLKSLTTTLLFSALLVSCASGKKKTEPELADLLGKKIALVEIYGRGEATAKRIVEVALVNQLSKHGSFFLVPKNELDQARVQYNVDATDWRKVSKLAGADHALRIDVQEFDTTEREGYSQTEEYDSQLAEERGEKEGIAKKVYKVKSLTGTVKFELEFTDLITGDRRAATTERTKTTTSEGKTEAIHLPPRLRYLETLSNEAFGQFFEKYQ